MSRSSPRGRRKAAPRKAARQGDSAAPARPRPAARQGARFIDLLLIAAVLVLAIAVVVIAWLLIKGGL